MATVGLIIIALLVLSFLVVIHEFGHFLAAKLVGVWPEEFGIGLPPRVWGKKIGETIWSINALPLGGFVRLHGETGENAHIAKPERAFTNKSKLARAFIAVAGVTMNLLFAVVAFGLIFFLLGIPEGISVEGLTPESPASAIGLKQGDTITHIDGKPLYNPNFFRPEIEDHAGKQIKITFRDSETGQSVDKEFVLRAVAPENQGLLGVSYGVAESKNLQGPSRLFTSLGYGALQTYDFSILILKEFGKMFSQIFSAKVPVGLTGPLGVVGVTAQAAQHGFLDLLNLAALISINLALLNLVPFPPLDGSRVMFLIVEGVVGRKRLPKFEEKAHIIGMYLLLALVVFLTFREVPKILTAGSLDGFVQSLIK